MFTGLNIQEQVPLAPFTTFKIGGPARYFLRAKTVSEAQQAIQQAQQHNIPWSILGGGSNILIHDQGFAGLVIKMEIVECTVADQVVTAGAGLLLSAAIRAAVNASLAGLEFAIGVPASVGGAVWANLGCRGAEISQVVQQVVCCTPTGEMKTLSAADCQFGYRDSIFKHQPWVIVQASFALQPAVTAELRQRLVELTKLKKVEQNVGAETAGCTFRNPPGATLTAAQCIEQLGLKGLSIGAAKISDKHANFILNTGGATADQVVQLVSYIKQQVRDQLGIQLMEEIEYIGFKP